MTTLQITDDLQQFVEKLSELKDATPATNPDYKDLKEKYTAASDLLASLQEKAIDDGNNEYQELSVKIKEAMTVFDEAGKNITKISKVIKVVAQVIDVVGKIVRKL